jgi:hypothetical protein
LSTHPASLAQGAYLKEAGYRVICIDKQPFHGTGLIWNHLPNGVGAESNFYWYVTFMCAIAFVAAMIMPNPKLKGYLQGSGTET